MLPGGMSGRNFTNGSGRGCGAKVISRGISHAERRRVPITHLFLERLQPLIEKLRREADESGEACER